MAPASAHRLPGRIGRSGPLAISGRVGPAGSELRARLNAGSLSLLDLPDLLAELRRLRTRYRAGHASVVNPRVGGSHGDIAQALALAVWEHDRLGFLGGHRGGAVVGNDGSIPARTMLGIRDEGPPTGKLSPDLSYDVTL